MRRPGGGHPEDVYSTGRSLHNEQDVQALEHDGVHGEETARQQALGLGAQERLPGGIYALRNEAGSDERRISRTVASLM